MNIRLWWKYRQRDRFWIWLSWHMPKPLAYWCCIRVITKTIRDAPDAQIAAALKGW